MGDSFSPAIPYTIYIQLFFKSLLLFGIHHLMVFLPRLLFFLLTEDNGCCSLFLGAGSASIRRWGSQSFTRRLLGSLLSFTRRKCSLVPSWTRRGGGCCSSATRRASSISGRLRSGGAHLPSPSLSWREPLDRLPPPTLLAPFNGFRSGSTSCS